MTGLQTNADLLKKLKESASRKLSSDEIDKQRVSFIMGSVGGDRGVTRDKIKEVLEKQEGRRVRA